MSSKDRWSATISRGQEVAISSTLIKMKSEIITVVACLTVLVFPSFRADSVSSKEVELVRKHVKRLKKEEGAIKLVGGREEYEGNVEILHNGKWGAICDDEWDAAEADVICRQLGYSEGVGKPTHNSHFGPARRQYWMDNVYCDGSEDEITSCRFDGWGSHDCEVNEAAGVICFQELNKTEVEKPQMRDNVMVRLPRYVRVRLRGGRVPSEGRVELKTKRGNWEIICGDGWSLLEANVVCRSLSLGYASDAMQTNYFGGNLTAASFSGVTCTGSEDSLRQCQHDIGNKGICVGQEVAAVYCVSTMSDLAVDAGELMRTAHLQDTQMFFLQCAMEENCLASHAYKIQKESSDWHLETRRLLRFTATILNIGTADFRPYLPKSMWEWHMCHMHYHSMEVFATFDVYDWNGVKVAEGHKASFCLEDNQCLPGVEKRYACANYGDQGISVNCSDIYKHNVDCQWVDVTDIEPGVYTLKVAVNPEFKIGEMSFENNAAVCTFYYTTMFGAVTNCTLTRP
ncbi:hypothetical protein PPYR_12315 [Photinus pyralis]|uniref:protein-lysine 6-oxidase n=2 Tax=Photinus pyralis TaxID=7054 RepID=A0A5N4ADT2_PHOPY|nr:hypothetical protein PPYR_12315 [Photinus pyralis]